MIYEDLMKIEIPFYYWSLESAQAVSNDLVLIFSRYELGKRQTLEVEGIIFDDIAPLNASSLPALKVTFEEYTSYAMHNESYYTREDDAKFEGASFQKTEESEYLTFVREHSFREAVGQCKLVHYSIITSDDFIDIATDTPPIIEEVELDESCKKDSVVQYQRL